jgi:hypothetical protein
MKLSLEAKRRWLVAFGFGAFVGLSLAAGYLFGMLPTFEEKCETHCKERGMTGRMEYVYPEPMTRGVRGGGPKECKCSR